MSTSDTDRTDARAPEHHHSTTQRPSSSRRRFLVGAAAATTGIVGLSGSAAGFDGDDGDVTGPWDYPRATTRDHFEIHWWHGDQLTDGHTATDYDTVGDVPGLGSPSPGEVVIASHGWLVEAEAAPDHFATVSASLSDNGYDHPVIGFSWDSDTSLDDWWPATDIAERNGQKLANFTADYAAANPTTTIRYTGHSLGARVVLEAIKSLNTWGHHDTVESAVLLGGAADDGSVAVVGEYGDDIAVAVGQFDNYWKTGDEVLNWAYSLGEFDSAVGSAGCDGSPAPNYADHNVEYVPDHFSYHEPGDGCVPEVVSQW